MEQRPIVVRPTSAPAGRALIETYALRREFGETVAVDDVSLSIQAGAVLALVGPNGAGKTTLLKMLAALLEPTSGAAEIDGLDVRERPREVHSRLGFLPDDFGLYPELTCRQYLAYFHLAYRLPPAELDAHVEEALSKAGLAERIDHPIGALSRGMRQRLGLARTVLHDPPLLLLDEPASGLDPGARGDLQRRLRDLARGGTTIVVSSHILSELEDYCSHVAILDRGRLLFYGTIADARRTAGKGRRFKVRALPGLDAARAACLADGCVSSWEDDGREGTFLFSGDDAAAAGLLKNLIGAGIAVTAFGEASGTIQDSYMAWMGQEAR